MATCSNCKKNLSCGCQKRTAADGKSVCSSCVESYNASLTQRQAVTATQPNTQVWGKDRYKINR